MSAPSTGQLFSRPMPIKSEVAEAYIAQLGQAHVFGRPVVTTVEPSKTFYAAEDYHQDFLERHPTHPYIVINDVPKVAHLREAFPTAYRPAPVLVASGRS